MRKKPVYRRVVLKISTLSRVPECPTRLYTYLHVGTAVLEYKPGMRAAIMEPGRRRGHAERGERGTEMPDGNAAETPRQAALVDYTKLCNTEYTI